ncbi:MAG: maltose alpha-D-glucosyltransferase [Chloroflexi bacterium]|nr:maltose alpha-D-glucosyltransferase [Chloroflexota bacterium]
MRPNDKVTGVDDDPLWFRDAIIYEVHVRAFYDSDRDGIGDFRGLTEKLDYLHDLGVTAIWLLPFNPSPLKDDGYDVSDYMNIHPNYGTLRDFKVFLDRAHQRGLRVITELVLNHTSDQHPWFQRARHAEPESRWRNYYVWSDTPEKFPEARIIFKDTESSNWSWDSVAKAYYWHRFYSHQPDLNYENPEVRDEMFKVVDFWLRLGVDGLRLDAVPYLFKQQGTNCENLPETHDFLKSLRSRIDQNFKNRMLLAEANQWPEDAVAYFDQGKECHMAFHFPLMPRLFMAISMEEGFPIIEVLHNTPPIPENCQWAVFLRNHDELTLEMVTDEERDYMYRVYARDDRARINLGIRHRLAPLLGNHRKRIELINGLLFSLVGSPVLYYGDEIGMGDNIYLGDRNGVRTPMQWSSDRNAGFSGGNPQRLYLPIIIDPAYHYEADNVEVQQNNPYSLLWWMKRLIAMRKRFKAFGRGSFEVLPSENRKILAFIRRYQDERILVVANLSRFVQGAEFDLAEFKGTAPKEIFGRTKLPPIRDGMYFVTLGPHDIYWFSLEPQRAEPPGPAERTPAQPPAVAYASSWVSLLARPAKGLLEEQLPRFLMAQPWFNESGRTVRSTEIVGSLPVPQSPTEEQLALVRVEFTEGNGNLFVLPIGCAAGDQARRIQSESPQSAIVALTGGSAPETILYDASQTASLPNALADAMIHHRRQKAALGEIRGCMTPEFRGFRFPDPDRCDPTSVKSDPDSATFVYSDQVFLQLHRTVYTGTSPDLELRRFLMDKTLFAHIVPVAGYIEYGDKAHEPTTVAILNGFVAYEENGWRYTQDTLTHFFEQVGARRSELNEIPIGADTVPGPEQTPTLIHAIIGPYLEFVRILAKRTAELHEALASESKEPDFAPEAFSLHYQRGLYEAVRAQCNEALALARREAEWLADGRERIHAIGLAQETNKRFHFLLDRKISGARIRCNGNYHLGQILYTGKDCVVSNFDGDLSRPVSQRRIKRSPLSDVAAMLLSFQRASIVGLKDSRVRSEDLSFLGPWARYWYRLVSAAFLSTYLDGARKADLLPKDELQPMLEFYMVEKALYTLVDALRNQPRQAEIALTSLARLFESRPDAATPVHGRPSC